MTAQWDGNHVLAFAAALQERLQTCVTPCVFLAGGRGSGETIPCGLVTIEPFTPGGFRRLALNVRSELIHEAALAFVRGGGTSALAEAALEFGAAVLSTSTWPVAGNFDVWPVIQWPMSAGLICGPYPRHGCMCLQRDARPLPHALPRGQRPLPMRV